MKLRKRVRSLIAFSLLILLLLTGGIVLRNFFLGQVKKKIQSAFNYSRISLQLFPPALVVEDIRTVSLSPFFSARKAVFGLSFFSLLKKEKPLTVYIEQPVVRITETYAGEEKKSRLITAFPLPFAIEKGLVRGGELYYWGKDYNFHAKDVKSLMRLKGDSFSIHLEAEDNVLFFHSASQSLEGKISFMVEGKGREFAVKKAVIEGSDFLFKAKGRMVNPLDPEGELKVSFITKPALVARILDFPFDWRGKAEGRGELIRKDGKLSFRSDLASDDLVLNNVRLERVKGQLVLGEKEGRRVELDIFRRSAPGGSVRIGFERGQVSGVFQRIYLEPILNYLSLPWPVKSPAWGTFRLAGGQLEVNAEFRDEDLVSLPGKFPFRGEVRLDWDGKTEIAISSEKLESSFGIMGLEGKVRLEETLDLGIQGEVTNLGQARELTSLILSKSFDFPEIRGKGKADIRITGDIRSPQVEATFAFSPGGFAKFDVASVEGTAEFIKNTFSGDFKVNDPFLKGEIHLLTGDTGLDAEIRLSEGNVEKILPGLDISLPLSGKASGLFQIRQKEDALEVDGSFSGQEVKFGPLPMRDVTGELGWREETLTFPELSFLLQGGEVQGKARLDLAKESYDLDFTGKGINLSSIYPDVQGMLTFDLKGDGIVGRDAATGHFEINKLHYAPLEEIEARGEISVDFLDNSIGVKAEGGFYPGNNDFRISFALPFTGKDISIDVKGNADNLDLLLPWKGAKGKIDYLAEIRITSSGPQVNGVVDFQGSLLPFPRFAHALRNYSGLIFIQNNKASVRSFVGKIGGGDVQGLGEVRLGKGGFEAIDLSFEGKNMLLSPLERTRALTDGTMRLIKDEGRFVLEGDLLIQKLSWRREVYEKFLFSSDPYYQPQKEPGFFDDLTLNIRLRALEDAWLENSLGRVKGRFDLSVTGNVNAPIVMGDIEALGGEVYFQDRKFKILKGRLSFFNPSTIEPYLEFRGETYVKDYRVAFSLTGLVDQLKPEFSSSPPLPPEDVLALLALGEAFKRTTSYDTSTQLSTASLLSFQLAEEAKKRAESVLSLDRFRIDPFVLGSSAEMTARLTVGKKISKNLFILYSTNLTTQREEIVRVEWELSDDLSVVGIRDEIGRLSFDVKIRKRF